MGQTADELRVDIERRRDTMSGTVDAIEDRVRPSRIIERRRKAFRGWVGDARNNVMGTRDDVAHRVSATAEGAAERVRGAGEHISEAPEQLAAQTRGAPLIAGGIAVGLGAMLALVLPETRAEHQAIEAIQPQLDVAKDAALDAGREALHTAQESATDAVAELKESATEHASQVGQQAKDAGDEIRQTAKDATGADS